MDMTVSEKRIFIKTIAVSLNQYFAAIAESQFYF
jgi:hypothetical protein